MNEQLSKSLTELIDFTKLGVLEGLNAVKEQMPELVNQILVWGIVQSCLGLVISITFMYFYVKFIKKIQNNDNDDCSDEQEACFMIIGTILFIIAIVIAICTVFEIFQIIFAPNLYLIQYMSNLIN